MPSLNLQKLVSSSRPPTPVQRGLPIAVDFGTTSLKVLQVSGQNSPSLVAGAALATPEPLIYDERKRLDFQLEQLPGLLRKGGFKGKRAACVIPTSRTFCKHLQLQPTDGVPMSVLIESLLPDQLGCPASATIYRYQNVPQAQLSGGRHEVICTATPRELIKRLMDVLREAKLEPVGMHTEFTALLAALKGLRNKRKGEEGEPEPSPDEPQLLLDLGYSATRVVIVHGEQMVFARSIDVGGRHFDEVIEHQLKYSSPDARAHRLAMESLTPTRPAEPRAEAPETQTDDDGDLDAEGGESLALLSAGEAKAGGVATQAGPATGAETGVKVRTSGDDVARRVSHAPGRGDPRAVDLSEPLEMLTDEVAHCLRYHESLFAGKRISSVMFAGGEARDKKLCAAIARALRMSAGAADPMARVARTGKEPTGGIDFGAPQPGWTAALGACLAPTDI